MKTFKTLLVTVSRVAFAIGCAHRGAILGALVWEFTDTCSINAFLPWLAEDFTAGEMCVFFH